MAAQSNIYDIIEVSTCAIGLENMFVELELVVTKALSSLISSFEGGVSDGHRVSFRRWLDCQVRVLHVKDLFWNLGHSEPIGLREADRTACFIVVLVVDPSLEA